MFWLRKLVSLVAIYNDLRKDSDSGYSILDAGKKRSFVSSHWSVV